MKSASMKLMNCTRCDDVVKLVEVFFRSCECGAGHGRLLDDGSVDMSGPARVLTIAWETYDGLTEGVTGEIGVLPRAQYRAKGGV